MEFQGDDGMERERLRGKVLGDHRGCPWDSSLSCPTSPDSPQLLSARTVGDFRMTLPNPLETSYLGFLEFYYSKNVHMSIISYICRIKYNGKKNKPNAIAFGFWN